MVLSPAQQHRHATGAIPDKNKQGEPESKVILRVKEEEADLQINQQHGEIVVPSKSLSCRH